MDTQPAFGFKELFTTLIGDMAKAICERNGESRQQQFARSQAAVHMIMGFLPRDVIEAMLAGHCVMFHELMVDTMRHTLLGEVDTMRRATRSSIVAMDKCFGNNLTRLERYQLRPAEGSRDAPEVDGQVATEIGERTSRPVAEESSGATVQGETPAAETGTVSAQTRPAPASPSADFPPETAVIFRPSADAIAACRANPEAMAALDAGDAESFARAMGIEMPSEAYLTAAGEGSLFDRQASGTRQAGLSSGAPKA